MKQLILALFLSTLCITTFAESGMVKIPAKKEDRTNTILKQKPYPVSGVLSCGKTVTFNTNCTGSVAQCIPEWNNIFMHYEQILCGGYNPL
jgi:hypothetical protein